MPLSERLFDYLSYQGSKRGKVFSNAYVERATTEAFVIDRKLISVWKRRIMGNGRHVEELIFQLTRPIKAGRMNRVPKITERMRQMRWEHPNSFSNLPARCDSVSFFIVLAERPRGQRSYENGLSVFNIVMPKAGWIYADDHGNKLYEIN